MNELQKFGRFFVQNSRDKMLTNLEGILSGEWKDESSVKLHQRLESFTQEQRKMVRDLVEDITTVGMHDLLFAFQEATDLEQGILINVDGINPVDLSDGLHGEIFGDDGWIAEFSSYKQTKSNQSGDDNSE